MKKSERLSRISIQKSQTMTIRRIFKGVREKNLKTFVLSVDLSKGFDSINRGKILACGIPQETVTAIMMFYKNTKEIVLSPDGEANFFAIVIEVL